MEDETGMQQDHSGGLGNGGPNRWRRAAISGLGLVALGWGGLAIPVRANPGKADQGLRTFATPVYAVERLGDGRILIGGGFNQVTDTSISDPIKEVPRSKVAQILPNGSLDTGFVPPTFSWGGSASNADVYSVAAQTNNKVLVGGRFDAVNGAPSPPLVRLNANGTLDGTFNGAIGGTVYVVKLQPDGQILVGNDQTGQGLQRLNGDGTVDGSFAVNLGANPQVLALELYPDGRILAGGYFNKTTPPARTNLVLLNRDGSVSGGIFPVRVQTVRALELAHDGKIYVGGGAGFFNPYGTPLDGVARLLADGSYDSSWTPEVGAGSTVYAIREQPDGRLIIGGNFTTVNGATRWGIARLRPDGNVDPVFGPPQLQDVRAFALLPEGGLVTGGANLPAMERLHDDGTGSGFRTIMTAQDPHLGGGVLALAVQPDGRIIAGGQELLATTTLAATNNLFRLRADGRRDPDFNPPTNLQWVSAAAVQDDGRTLVAGYAGNLSTATVLRLTYAGLPDAGFAAPAFVGYSPVIRGLSLQPDGRVLAWGGFTNVNGTARFGLVRLNTNGTVDAGFAATLTNACLAAALQGDGKLLVSGFYSAGTTNQVFRLNTNGTVDASFTPWTIGSTLRSVQAIAVQADGAIVVGGEFDVDGRRNLARLQTNGTLDASFACTAASVTNGVVRSVVLDASGKLAVGMDLHNHNGFGRSPVVQVMPDGGPDLLFAADLVFFPGSYRNSYASLARQRDGRLLAAGLTFEFGAQVLDDTSLVRVQNDPPAGRLEFTAPGELTWSRSASVPEAQNVWFELSQDGGMTWTRLGDGVRIPGGWRLGGLALPWSGIVRARARTPSGTYNGSSGVVEQAAPFATRAEVVLATWLESFYQTPFVPTRALMFSDTDQDGSPNLREFAFGTLPNEFKSGFGSLEFAGSFINGGQLLLPGQPTLRTETGFGDARDRRLLFVRRSDHARLGLRYVPEFSSDLQAWAEAGEPGTVVAGAGDYEVVSLPLPPADLSPEPEKWFARIRLHVEPEP